MPRGRKKGHDWSWTETEKQFLRDNYLQMSQSELAERLKRSRKSTQAKIERMKLQKPRTLYTTQGYERNPELLKVRKYRMLRMRKESPEKFAILPEEQKRRARLPRPTRAITGRKMFQEGRWIPPILQGHVKFQDTRLEQAVAMKLNSMNIVYLHPFNIDGKHCADFYVPDLNLVIEADGCYWHGCHACGFEKSHPLRVGRDEIRNAYIRSRGFNLLVVPEHEFRAGFPSMANLGGT